FRMKADGSGQFYNSIWTEFTGAFMRLDDTVTFERFEAGDITFTNNVLYNFGKGGNDLDSILDIRAKDPALFAQHLRDNNDQIKDPQLRGISWSTDGGLDPRPAKDAAILTEAISLTDEFFTPVSFIGAFGDENWAAGWTALTEYGIFGDLDITGVSYLTNDQGLSLSVVNPVEYQGTVFVSLPESSPVKFDVFDLAGRNVIAMDFGQVASGKNSLNFDASNLQPGIYVAVIRTNRGGVSAKFIAQ
ncbi:MAG: T9SS type A sorting domain-containing protein, partial [Saprospiraceae bacterium]|nr:T9SS type A sorting domain-containing protein [Saprospiraceae bacterium]